MNPVFENSSLIIVTAESDFVYFFCVNIMRMRTNDIDSHSFCVNIMFARTNNINFHSFCVNIMIVRMNKKSRYLK